MFVEQFIANLTRIQCALSTVAELQLTSYKYPQAETVLDGAQFDFVVVGAGSAGSVIASRLTEDPSVSVLLIEAGGDPPIESNIPGLFGYIIRSRVDWNHTTEQDHEAFQCLRDHRYSANQGKMLGGTSSLNGMLYVRGHRDDYDSWAKYLNDQSWNFSSVLPYFKKSERLEVPSILNSSDAPFHGTDGYLKVTKVNNSETDTFKEIVNEMGYDFVVDINGNNNLGFTEQLVTMADGLRQSTANAFISPIKSRPNLHVLKETLATKVLIQQNKATGVVVTDINNNTFTVIANKEVIISAGAIKSPQLLLLSGVGPKQLLQSFNKKVLVDLPVGQNLQNHDYIFLVIRMPHQNHTQETGNPYHDSPNVASGYLSLNASQSSPDFQVITGFLNDVGLVSVCATFAYSKEICQHFYNEVQGRYVLTLNIANLKLKSRGTISLNSLDPNESPAIHIRPYSEEEDLENTVSYVKDIMRIVNTTYLKSVGAEFVGLPSCASFEAGSRDYWRCYVRCMSASAYHFAGTCAMGSVVDSRLRVYGVRGLRVADASVMPTLVSGNTNAPSIMIGEKAADLIKEDNGMRL